MQTNQHVDAERKTTWTITHHDTVLAILSVQDSTMLDFNVTEDHLNWAIAIDSGNGEQVLNLQIPIYTLRNRTVFTSPVPGLSSAPRSPPAIPNKNPLINPDPSEPPNSPAAHSPTHNLGPNDKKAIRMSRSAFARTGLSGSEWAVALVEVYSDSEDAGGGSATESESLNDVILESDADVSDASNASDKYNNYWSLQHQYQVLGESYEDYLEH